MHNRWYAIFKNVLAGPALRLYNRPTCTGVENIPAEGGAVLASNHQSVVDSFFLPLMCPRQITFLAKAEYFTGTGFVGGLQKWFFTAVGQVPIDRSSRDAAQAALNTGIDVVKSGDLLGIYPEGTRSPDGRIYRGKLGMAGVALATGAPVIPVIMKGTRKANPIGSWLLRPAKVSMVVADPIDPIAYVTELGLDPTSHEARRALTDHVTRIFADVSGQDYVDRYAADVKEELAKGLGLPPSTYHPKHS